MTRPACRVYLGFGSTWLTEPGSIVWTEVTGRVMDRRQPISTMRGSTSWHGEPDTGDLSLTLRNSDRHLDPLYTAGPHYGDLVPGVPIKVEGTPEGMATAAVWWGTVKSWPQGYDRGNRISTVPVRAFDRFDKLARAKIPRSVLEVEMLADDPLALYMLDETSGTTMIDRSGNGRHGTYDRGTTDLSEVVEFPGGGRVRGIRFDGEHRAFATHRLDNYTHATGGPSTLEEYEVALVAQPDVATAATSGAEVFATGNGASEQGRVDARIGEAGAIFRWRHQGDTPGAHTDRTSTVTADLTDPSHYLYYLVYTPSTADKVFVDGVDSVSATAPAPDGNAQNGTYVGGWKDRHYRGWVAAIGFYNKNSTDFPQARATDHYNAANAPLEGQTTGERITWILDELGWPVNLRDLETGDTILGAATFEPGDNALEYLRRVAATEDSLLYITADGKVRFLNRYWRYTATEATTPQVTFTDNGSGIPVSHLELEPADDELIVNVAQFTRRGGTEQVAVNTASRERYGEAGKRRTDLLHGNDLEVMALAEWTVATQGTPTPRVPQVTVNLHKLSPERQAQLLALDLGHRVRCVRTPQGVGTPFSIDLIVDGIQNKVAATEWVMELYLSPAHADTAPVFTLGTSTLGGTSILGY